MNKSRFSKMEFAFLDESGDLGKDSQYLVLTLICVKSIKKINKIIRKAKQRLLRKNKSARWLSQHGGEIKFYGFPDQNLLKSILIDLSNLKMHIYFLAFDKNESEVSEKVKPLILSKLFAHIFDVSGKVIPKKIIADLNFFNKEKKNYFILSKYGNSPYIKKDENDVEQKKEKKEVSFVHIDKKEYLELKGKKEMILVIEHKNSRTSEPLQAVDLISGALFNDLKNNRKDYLNIFEKGKSKIKGNSLIMKNVKGNSLIMKNVKKN